MQFTDGKWLMLPGQRVHNQVYDVEAEADSLTIYARLERSIIEDHPGWSRLLSCFRLYQM